VTVNCPNCGCPLNCETDPCPECDHHDGDPNCECDFCERERGYDDLGEEWEEDEI